MTFYHPTLVNKRKQLLFWEKMWPFIALPTGLELRGKNCIAVLWIIFQAPRYNFYMGGGLNNLISHWQIGIGDKPGGVWGCSPRKFWKLSALRAFLEHLKQFLKHNNSSKICYFYYDKIFLAHFWYQGAAAPQYRAPVFLSTQVWQPLATRNFIALRGVWGPCTRKSQ